MRITMGKKNVVTYIVCYSKSTFLQLKTAKTSRLQGTELKLVMTGLWDEYAVHSAMTNMISPKDCCLEYGFVEHQGSGSHRVGLTVQVSFLFDKRNATNTS